MSYSTGHFHCNMYIPKMKKSTYDGKVETSRAEPPPPQPFLKINHKIIPLHVCVTQC